MEHGDVVSAYMNDMGRLRNMKSNGFSTGIWTFGPGSDRFCVNGYKEGSGFEESLDKAASVEGLSGLMMHYPNPVNEESIEHVGKALKDRGLALTSCEVDLFSDPVFSKGSLMSEDPALRKKALEMSKKAMDMAEALGAPAMNLWPGQDGFDYPFQIDYTAQWNLLIDAIKEIASHNTRVKLGLEYKLREPRTHSSISASGVALFLAQASGLPNVGVTLDLGHSFNCKESPGNVVAMLDTCQKLFVLHLNDNFRDWDDDMVVGTVHFWETLEFLYYLNRSSFEGWLGLDIFPYREDATEACSLSIENINYMLTVVDRVDYDRLKALQKEADALAAFRYMKSLL